MMDAVNDTVATYAQQIPLTDEENSLDMGFQRSTRNDGWCATILLGSLIFGPEVIVDPSFPPFRFADIMILFLLFTRGIKAMRFYGGFLFSYRIRGFNFWILCLTLAVSFSMAVNVLSGHYPFFYKDLFIPVVFLRMILIASIASSFNFQTRQIRQFALGIILISTISVSLAFAQRAGLLGYGSIMETLYLTSAHLQRQAVFDVTARRVVGTFGNPNVFGGCLVMLAAMTLPLAINMRGTIRYLSIGLFLALSGAVLMTTGSRTALVGLLLVTSLALPLSFRRGSRFTGLIFVILFVVAVVFIRTNIYALPVSQRLQDAIAGKGVTTAESFLARVRMWKFSLALVKESPFFGLGATKTWRQLTDNGYIFMLLRVGILGLSIYVLWLLAMFIKGMMALRLEYDPSERSLLLSLIMVLVNHAVFEITGEFFWNIQYSAIFIAFMGMLYAISTQLKYEHQEATVNYEV